MFDLSGKTALITGASGGIGSAIAAAMHGQGAAVVLSGTRREVLENLAGKLGDGRAHALPGNLGAVNESPDAVAGLIAEAGALAGAGGGDGGGVDILVNNAGITRDNLLMRMKDSEWDEVLAVNLKAAMVLSRAALRGMMKKRFGRIIQISSIVGYTGNPGQANYAAAKAGLAGFTKALAAEVASRGITANMIAPGFIATPMTDSLTDAQREGLLGNVPAGRLGEAGEIAAAAVYLASGEAGYVTGATLHVNGGMAML